MTWFIKNKFIKKDCSVSLNFKRLDLIFLSEKQFSYHEFEQTTISSACVRVCRFNSPSRIGNEKPFDRTAVFYESRLLFLKVAGMQSICTKSALVKWNTISH